MIEENKIARANKLRDRAVELLDGWLKRGTFYKWAGDDPSGLDCSGLVIEVLTSVGILPHRYDGTADDLYRLFKPLRVDFGYPGCLVFWGVTRITHVAMMYDNEFIIEAGGGGSTTLTEDDAIAQNAFVRQRPLDYRGKDYVVCDPFKVREGDDAY